MRPEEIRHYSHQIRRLLTTKKNETKAISNELVDALLASEPITRVGMALVPIVFPKLRTLPTENYSSEWWEAYHLIINELLLVTLPLATSKVFQNHPIRRQ